MANARRSPNLPIQAFPTSPSSPQTLPSEAVLDALKMMLIGASLDEVLTSITRLIEAHSEGMLCSIFLLDEDGLHLRYGVAPNLPQAYQAATDGTCIGPNVGSCGAAAYLRQPVFVSDILSHPNFANLRSVVLQSGLRAAWSTPIVSQDGKVLGRIVHRLWPPARGLKRVPSGGYLKDIVDEIRRFHSEPRHFSPAALRSRRPHRRYSGSSFPITSRTSSSVIPASRSA